MTLQDILQSKGGAIYRAYPGETLATVVNNLVQHNCGSLVVCDANDEQKLLGIITERDILRACAGGKAPLAEVEVTTVMTRDVIVGAMGDTVHNTMSLLTEKRIRHLPVIENDRLVGIISIGDVVKAEANELSAENHYLKEYIQR